jgi:hypothetical protein
MGFVSFSEDISKRADENRQAGASIPGPAGGIPARVYVVRPFKFDPSIYIVRRQRHDPGYELHDAYCEIHRLCDEFTRRLSVGTESEEWEAIFDHAIHLLRKWGSPKDGKQGTPADMAELNGTIEKTQTVADCLCVFGAQLLDLVESLARLKHFHPAVKLDDAELAIEEHASDVIRSWREISMLPKLLDGLYEHPEIDRLRMAELEREWREWQGTR